MSTQTFGIFGACNSLRDHGQVTDLIDAAVVGRATEDIRFKEDTGEATPVARCEYEPTGQPAIC
jgi:hypothetical protein